jgi:hypothetical protein
MCQSISSEPVDKNVVAHHEAGHAVIARRLGLTVKKVTRGRMCFEGVELEGYADVPECRVENPAYSEQCLLIALAGPAAQKHYDPVGYKRDGVACARIDYDIARRSYCRLSQKPDCKDKDLASAKRKAKALVVKHWSAIEAVAQKLVNQTVLIERGLDALLDSLP